MVKLSRAILLGLAFVLASPIIGQARYELHVSAARAHARAGYQPAITLSVSTGYGDVYRAYAWTPVRVTLQNRTASDVSGTVQIPEHGQSPSLAAEQSFHGLYSAPVTVPAGSAKQVTLYVPGAVVQGQIQSVFESGGRTLAVGSSYPMGIDSGALLVGVFGGGASDVSWLVQASQGQATSHVIKLSSAILDPVSDALSTFDIIVLTNADTSRLDAAQLDALERFVSAGGSLLLIGGPAWQQTLRPLPAALVPGRLMGSRTVSDLHGLSSLGSVPGTKTNQATEISILSHPTGIVLATQAGIPLVVRRSVGRGVIEYLAFDPTLNPVKSWPGASGLLGHVVATSAPLAVARSSAPQGIRSRFIRTFSTMSITSELANLPGSRLRLLGFFALLTVIYVVIVGPASFLVLRRLNRQQLVLITIPALALVYVGSVFALSRNLRGSSSELNTIAMVTLDGTAHPHPATFYVGMIAPLDGSYHVTYKAPALPAGIPRLSNFSFRTPIAPTTSQLGLQMQEGSQTQLTFPSMKSWTMRDVALNTTVSIAGRITSDLRINSAGEIVGTIHNGTSLKLLDPVIVVGQAITHLPSVPPGTTVHTRIRPNNDNPTTDQSTVWTRLYGSSNSDFGSTPFWNPGGLLDGPSFSQERSLSDRIRNAASVLVQTQALGALGNVVLVAWSDQPLGSFTVDGSTPQRRDLNLIAMPLTVHLPSAGTFQLRPGALGPKLVDIAAQPPKTSCCNFFSRSGHQIEIGPGGSVTLAFTVPETRHVSFGNLAIAANGVSDGTPAGAVFDWRTSRWVHVNLSSTSINLRNPNRFVSSDGRVLLKMSATNDSGDITIDDINSAAQISGMGKVT